jgi:DNA-binding MarR family transcriptional regulator
MARQRDLNVLAQAIDRDLRAIRARIRRPLEAAIAQAHLTGPQLSAMHALVESGGMSLKELSAHLGLAHSTVSGIVDRLQKRGLVLRQTDKVDKRITHIHVTRRVRAFIQEALPGLSLHPLAEALERADPAQRRLIEEGLHTLRKLLENA